MGVGWPLDGGRICYNGEEAFRVNSWYELVVGDCPGGHDADCVRLRVMDGQSTVELHLDNDATHILAARLAATPMRPQSQYYPPGVR